MKIRIKVILNTRVNLNISILISTLTTSSFLKYYLYNLILLSTLNFSYYIYIIFKALFRLSRSLSLILDFIILTYKFSHTLFFSIFFIFSIVINFFFSLT